MSKTMIYERDPRSHEEIMKAARQMRADYIRELFGKLRAALSGHGDHGPALTPNAR
ncbi:RSP_7527 family protein [Azospirillum agricola]|uniref:RSP_7527 family protein n=1 Tax=Azospirillum agricola TaxID=1720247 RepID=UPI000A0F287D|nr:hypothetical protein [Azospirillum agricola]SMH59736.1 hypothetical protein SAMN02982994_5183 [Azospirillum lipoferum]